MQDRTKVSNFVQHYYELNVYKLAFKSAMEIYSHSKNWPKEERYSLSNQIRRSSRSVCGNIAEAWRKRRYPAHFTSKLSDADSESAETEVWLCFAKNCGYIEDLVFIELSDNYDHICRMLASMMAKPDKWKLKNSR